MKPNPNFVSLNAVTATGQGTPGYVPGTRTYGIQVVYTGGSPTVVVTLKGSNNGGKNFFTIGTWTTASQSNGDIIFVVDKPCTWIVASLDTLTGGTTPTVTATISSS